MPQKIFQKTKEVPPYTKLAFIYDFLMRHVNYDDWASYLARLFTKADFEIVKVIDISCGTGKLLYHLADLGFELSGQDYSYEMVKIAKRRLKRNEYPAFLWAGSMVDLAAKSLFDAVVTTYDSLNYCRDLSQCEKVFEQVGNIIKPGGVFIFDISTINNSKRYFKRYYDRDSTNKFDYIRQSYYLPDKQIQVNEFHITWQSNKGVCYKEYHEQKIYRIRELKDVIPQQMFEVLGVYDGFSLRPGTEKSDRVHFLLKKI